MLRDHPSRSLALSAHEGHTGEHRGNAVRPAQDDRQQQLFIQYLQPI